MSVESYEKDGMEEADDVEELRDACERGEKRIAIDSTNDDNQASTSKALKRQNRVPDEPNTAAKRMRNTGPAMLWAPRRITNVMAHGPVYVCGTGGLLARLTKGKPFIYKTGTSDDVIDMMIRECNGSNMLIATTRAHVLIYDPFEAQHNDSIIVPRLRRVEAKGLKTYPVSDDGWVKIYDRANYTVKYVNISGLDNVLDFFPTTKFPDEALITLKTTNRLHHASRADDYAPGEAVSDVKDVREVIGGSDGHCLCYSENTVWVLNEDFEVGDSAVFRCGIVCVAYSVNSMVVLDRNNRLHTYGCTDDYKLCCLDVRAFEEDITAVAVNPTEVFLLLGNRLIAYYYLAASVFGRRKTRELNLRGVV